MRHALSLSATLVALAWSAPAVAIPAVALTSANTLHRFDTATPGTLGAALAITGLAQGETLVGADFRPATGELIAIGRTSRIYSIDLASGLATALGAGPFAPALEGDAFGVDFNPTVDRIRVVSDSGQNLRLNPLTGGLAATDVRLAYATGDPAAGVVPVVAAAAYTNNYGGATATTLYDIDVARNTLVTQIPPNNGTLNTVGALGIDATAVAGFDISGGNGGAFAAITVQGGTVPNLYSIDLATGAATLIGAFGAATVVDLSIVPGGAIALGAATYSASEDSGTLSVTVNRVGGTAGVLTVAYATSDGTAVAPGDYTATSGTLTFADGSAAPQTIQIPLTADLAVEGTETATLTLSGLTGRGDLARRFATLRIVNDDNVTLWGLTQDGRLLTFEDDAPGTITATLAISGLQAGEALHGIDFRPADGQLYALSSTSRLYRIDPLTGVATMVGAGPLATALEGTDFGIDFNPTVDRLRVVSDSGQNLRLNPNDGAVAATDTPLAYAAADVNANATPRVVGAAYTNSFVGAMSTVLYDIDAGLDVLATQLPPNAGTLNTVGALGLDVGSVVGFDINSASGDTALAVMTPVGGAQGLYGIDLGTGRATLVGTIGSSAALRGFAIGTGGGFQLSSPTYTVSESGGMVTVTITRTGGTSGPASVTYGTVAGSATAGLDYTESMATLSFGHMDASRTVDIAILPDMIAEGDESFVIRLLMPSTGARLGLVSTATITIADDDAVMMDAGVIDSGAEVDSGVLVDGGGTADSGPVVRPDAASNPDATVPRADAGVVVRTDAGTDDDDDSGCGCSTGSPASSGLLSLLLVGGMLLVRRRRS